jgi:hypothetical protein
MTDANAAASTQASRIIESPGEALYRAFTDPKALAVWLSPGDMTGKVHEFDAGVGGGYRTSLFYPSLVRTGAARQDLGAGRPFSRPGSWNSRPQRESSKP